ncbi:isopentenyl-diphosphate Delta-isomerase [Corynebacterium cystitidis]|uniref:Isopentenyl-diphosphate Delta-isomerase n=1 Tax=Corynebacterium cystitidis DSM 20524 TaxID=1121357 RepID=A0A1H9W5L1_9CORY|nr:isopentenyl-diphosphate Delta-isomerase [Corynebacterium cystitidis]WJY83212.1 Isopentenyl-diphosphate Delta-isomerase [Corynebacterium cystitidis DSM 20524]SES29155.1 isopentenyl-diphosphate delta-isomerase [Corynebacterium cystitidis DSM 20524]SNV67632.1 isopentenyl-diphosphate delta-isomerase [Corynebacterium cystitidis]
MSERVVLLDDNGAAIGEADKAEVHTTDTALHLAFSAWVFDADGDLLITRRSLAKQTFAGVWTNSFCGHPAPGEEITAAVRRRGREEAGIAADYIGEIREVIPDYRYRATDVNGIVENEICPVYVVRLHDGALIGPEPSEIDAYVWADPRKVLASVETTPWVFSDWMVGELFDPRLRSVLAGR